MLFHGQPGTGKSLAAEAVGYEVGKALKVSCRKLNKHSNCVIFLLSIGCQLW